MQLIDVIRSGELREDNELDAAFQSLAQSDTAAALELAEEIVDTNTLDRVQSVIAKSGAPGTSMRRSDGS